MVFVILHRSAFQDIMQASTTRNHTIRDISKPSWLLSTLISAIVVDLLRMSDTTRHNDVRVHLNDTDRPHALLCALGTGQHTMQVC